MSLEQIWPQLTMLRTEEAEGDSVAWKVLYAGRRQPLLVPLDPTEARSAISFFMRNPLLRYWGYMLLALDRLLPRARLLPTVRLENFPYKSLFNRGDLSCVALFFGFPGPLQKLTVYCPGINGEPGIVAKVALQDSSDDAIAQEAHWLGKLNRLQALKQFLPRLLVEGTLSCGRRYISMLALPPGLSSSHFDTPHYAFLRVLAQQKPMLYVWRQSEAYQRMQRRLQAISPLLQPSQQALLLDALNEVDLQIGDRELPASMVHGDFAPWNLRICDDRLFVFDWEYAEACGNPLQDFLHFHLIPRALQRWPLRTRWMPGLLEKTRQFADRLFGPDSGVAGASGALVTHYLLDTITFYVEASGELDMQHPVLSTYLRLLDERAAWLPATDMREAGSAQAQLKHG